MESCYARIYATLGCNCYAPVYRPGTIKLNYRAAVLFWRRTAARRKRMGGRTNIAIRNAIKSDWVHCLVYRVRIILYSSLFTLKKLVAENRRISTQHWWNQSLAALNDGNARRPAAVIPIIRSSIFV